MSTSTITTGGDGYRDGGSQGQPIQLFAFVVAVFFCLVLGGVLTAVYFFRSKPASVIELDEKINPNDAPVGSLTRLPGIGLVRANAIVDYRQRFMRNNGNNRAFKNDDDLQKVKGIGPKTTSIISPLLQFKQDRSTGRTTDEDGRMED